MVPAWFQNLYSVILSPPVSMYISYIALTMYAFVGSLFGVTSEIRQSPEIEVAELQVPEAFALLREMKKRLGNVTRQEKTIEKLNQKTLQSTHFRV